MTQHLKAIPTLPQEAFFKGEIDVNKVHMNNALFRCISLNRS